MDPVFPQLNTPPQPKTVWENNPHLRRLLVALMFTFIFSGIFLSLFYQILNYYRTRLYVDTEGSLPIVRHIVKAITLPDGHLRVDEPQNGDTIGQFFQVSGYAQGWFEGNIPIKVLDANGNVLLSTSTIAQNNMANPAPFSAQLVLDNVPTTATGTMEFTQFSAKDGSVLYQKSVNVKFAVYIGVIPANWKIYKNKQYRFELQYPKEWFQFNLGKNSVRFSNKPTIPTLSDQSLVNDSRFTISIEANENSQGLSIHEYSLRLLNGGLSSTPLSTAFANIDGQQAFRAEVQDIGDDYIYYILSGKDVITIEFPTAATQPQIENTYMQILSSFKFTK